MPPASSIRPAPRLLPRQVTSAARQALRRAVLEGDPRLVEALFLCEVKGGGGGALVRLLRFGP